jgi:hypothetical protein
MVSRIRRFWRQLANSVHPDDEAVFRASPDHTFNLGFPPPAFIGQVDTAPIVILMSNGGYKPGQTEAEFPDASASVAYRRWLHGDISTPPHHLARYYTGGPFAEWITSGKAVVVNAVAYRSPRLSQEKSNQAVARRLPSHHLHRQWLMEDVLPAARDGKRFVLVHRNGLWNVPTANAGDCVLFSDPMRAEPNRAAPDRDKLRAAENWLQRTG